MKLMISLSLFALSTVSFAGSYSLDCSNSEGSIRITEGGTKVQVYNESYSSVVKLKGLEIWDTEANPEVTVEAVGKRKVLSSYKSKACREVTDLVFAQELSFRSKNNNTLLATDFFICQNSSATTSGGCEL